MKDTGKKVERLLLERNRRLTPTEKARMGSSMFDTARELLTCGLKNRNPNHGSKGIRRSVFEYFYGNDFASSTRIKIMSWLDAEAGKE